jgi:putative endopeptidase
MFSSKSRLKASLSTIAFWAGTAMLAGLSIGLSAQAEERRCLDEKCHYLSLPSLDMLLDISEIGSNETGTTTVSTEAKRFGTWGFDTAGMDRSVKPGNDFFSYANGTAVKNLVIPADRSSYGSFHALGELSENRLKGLVESVAQKTDLNADEAKIAYLYNGYSDIKGRDKLDFKPMQATLDTLKAIETKSDLARYFGTTHGNFGSTMLIVSVYTDFKDPNTNILYVGSSGLGLPDRDYYLEAKFKDKKIKYEAYVAKILTYIGYANPRQNAKAIVALETEMAKAAWTRIEQRDIEKQYNPMTRAELKAYAPGFDWDRFLIASGVIGAKKIVVNDNTAVAKYTKIFDKTNLETLKAWSTFKAMDQAAPYLSTRFSDANWTFWSKELSGTEVERPVWKRAVSLVEDNLGEVLGKTYVATYFPAQSKAKVVSLVADLKAALKIRIDNLDWMSPATKAKAQEKLAAFTVKIGYPDKWRDYSKLEIKPNDLIGNIERSGAFNWQIALDKLDKPVDKSEWGMTPQTVNAYYNPLNNEIVFPAAILQPPFFDAEADPAINYGGIGGVIGHEITHGFDDQGRKFAADGALSEWWQPEDKLKFEVQADRLGAQYDTYEPLPGAKVQGKLTMGENIADYGGVTLGLAAYNLSLKGKAAPIIDGFTGNQRVMLGWAQVWRSRYRDDALRNQVVTDPHSPSIYRVNGVLRNIDAWYTEFDVKPGETYYTKPEDRVRIW